MSEAYTVLYSSQAVEDLRNIYTEKYDFLKI